MFKKRCMKVGATVLLLCTTLVAGGCMTNPNAQWGAVDSPAGNPVMDYVTALELVTNWRAITTGGFAFLDKAGAPTANETGVTVTLKSGDVYRCLYADTPNPVVTSKFLASPSTVVVLNCRGSMVSVWGSEMESKTLVAAWKTMLAGPPVDSPEQVAAFDAAAAKYRADPAAFALPEEARALKIQAESAVREKRLWDAVDRYSRALAISPSWAPGHFNLALIYGEVELPGLAMAEMNKYLKLAPDAKNARAAQDKIYEWQDKGKR